MELIARYAWGFALAGLVLLGGAAVSVFLVGQATSVTTGLLVAGGVALLLYPALDRAGVERAVTARSFRLGSGSALLVALAAGIAGFGYTLAERYDRTWDLTSKAKYTLSEQSRAVISGLADPVEVLAFYRAGSPGEADARRLLGLFSQGSTQLSVRFIDPLREPRLAEQHEVRGEHGVVVVQRRGRDRRIEGGLEEEALTRALLLLGSEVTHRVCWAMGHGEPDPDDAYSDRGLGGVVSELEGMNYQIVRLPVATAGVARDCEAVVVARPTSEWLPYEREALAAYLAEGGGVLVLLEPGTVPDFAASLDRYAVAVGDDLVIDVSTSHRPMGVDDPSLLVLWGRNLLGHEITDSLSAALFLPIVRSVVPLQERPGFTARALLQTSEASWAERTPDAEEVGPDADELQGDVPVGVVVTIDDPAAIDVAPSTAAPAPEADPEIGLGPSAPPDVTARDPGSPSFAEELGRAVPADLALKPGGKLVVLGDSDFASNRWIGLGNNRDLFLNTVAWLVDEKDQLGERPANGDALDITVFGEAMLCLVSVIFVPGGAVLLALATLLRRRML